MTIRIARERGQLVVDIRTKAPDGSPLRKRHNAPDGIRSESALRRWAEVRQGVLAGKGLPREEVPAPTLKEFGERWMEEYARANGNKPSTLAAKRTILDLHLYPVLGVRRLDHVGAVEIQRLKLHLAEYAPKTKACVLSQLATILRTAEEWEEIVKAPKVKLPKVPREEMEFYDFAEWDLLIQGARRAGPMVLSAVLLGGDAGLRRGELVALEWADVGRVSVRIVRNEWEGHVGTTKGGGTRAVPLTARLREALAAVRHLRGKRVLWQPSGKPVGVPTLQSWLEVACKRAGLPPSRNIHKLRHTFGSHLAMRGVPARTIQELMGHADLATTMKYMHLARGSAEAAIASLEAPSPIAGGAEGEQGSQDGAV